MTATSDNPHIVAVFLFNHRFERNVEKLERMYANRFSRRRYIMPFASDDPRLIRVHETSWNFSGHIAQAADGFRDAAATHYLFVADDLVLNPALDEINIVDALGCSDGSAYIKSLASIDSLRYRWFRALVETANFDGRPSGFDHLAELPRAAEAQARFEKMGLRFDAPRPRRARDWLHSLRHYPSLVGPTTIMRFARNRTSYPLLFGYSDLLLVPAAAIKQFVRYCGVFAAMNVFAEVAVPTALALATDRIRTELALNEHFQGPAPRSLGASLKGLELWGQEAIDAYAARFDNSLARLEEAFPQDLLYVHPIKLSRFQ